MQMQLKSVCLHKWQCDANNTVNYTWSHSAAALETTKSKRKMWWDVLVFFIWYEHAVSRISLWFLLHNAHYADYQVELGWLWEITLKDFKKKNKLLKIGIKQLDNLLNLIIYKGWEAACKLQYKIENNKDLGKSEQFAKMCKSLMGEEKSNLSTNKCCKCIIEMRLLNN